MNRDNPSNLNQHSSEPRQPNFPADDRFVRFIFSNMPRMAGLLHFGLPAKVASLLDFSGLRRLHDQQVGNTLHEMRDDLNLECPLKGGRGNVIIRIIFEHKSVHDRKLWFQLVRSCVSQWETTGIAPVIAVILHTGTEVFHFHSPKSALVNLPEPIREALLDLQVWAIDFHKIIEEDIWQSKHLDRVSKITLSILKLSQMRTLTLDRIRQVLSMGLPEQSRGRQRRYLIAAMSYIKRKNAITPDEFQQLRQDMSSRWAHPMVPNSYADYELREERAKGLELGQIDVIQGMLVNGLTWDLIEKVTHLNEAQYQTLVRKHQGKTSFER